MKLVIYPPIDEARLAAITVAAGPMTVVNAAEEAAACREIVDAEAMFGKMTPSMLAAATRLRWIQSPTASLEHYVFAELVAHPAVLTNMRGIYSDVIAEHVLGMMLAFNRQLPRYLRQQAAGQWNPAGGEHERVSFLTGPGVQNAIDRAHRTLAGMTLGIVGLGEIGREVARRGQSFAMRIVAVDPIASASELVSTVWRPEALDQLLAVSDFVVIAAPHTLQTQGMFARAQFQRMKRDAHLINVGRGAIVRLDDLVAALEAGEIAGAGLDVFEIEPLPHDHPLWRLRNVILTPHVAGQALPVAARHLAVVVDNVRRFVAGEPLVNVVDKARWF